ncbi:BLUF domain-containing protein [Agaribacterium sp. ZY112]|uniref:BLUF domain-containing protein n=1 Tax=Agaribacterium sp. ZY112 TaxID=3233574 RepID=UPI00352516F9
MYRLIYKSKSQKPIDWACVEDIMHSSEKHNQINEITGVLLASETHFLQVIEGHYEHVNQTYCRIINDNRHGGFQLIAFHPVDARLFESWSMKGIGVFNFNQQTALALSQKYGEEEGGLRFPLEEWQALALIQDVHIYLKAPDWKQ